MLKSLSKFVTVIDQNFEYVQNVIPDFLFDQNNAFQPVWLRTLQQLLFPNMQRQG